MTVADSAHSEFAALDDSVSLDGLAGILRTAGVEPALLTDEHAQSELVKGNKFDEDCF